MPRGNLPDSGPVGFGLTVGDNASFNNFQDIKRAQGTSSQNTLANFINWCSNYVEPPGDPNNVLNAGAPYRASETRNLEIIKFTVWIKNETFSKYGTNNDAAVQIRVDNPNDGRTSTISVQDFGSSTIVNGTAQSFGGSGWDAGASKLITITDNSTSVSCQLYVIPGYNNNNAAATGTATAGGAGVSYPKGGTTSFNNPMTFYSGPRDPSGRPQG